MIMPLKIEASSYNFTLPVSFLPNLKSHKEVRFNGGQLQEVNLDLEYTFSYNIEVLSQQKITYLSTPTGSKTEKAPRGFTVSYPQSAKVPKREIKVFYRVDNMLKPQLKYQKNTETGEVACMASFVPTFVPSLEPQDAEITNDQPEEVMVSVGQDFHFIFIVDRSGSMGGQRIAITREALAIFLKSLPVGCNFSILSFGSTSSFSNYKG